MKCGHGVDQNISYCGRCEWKRAEAARIWGQALEVQNERLERETRSVGKDIALSEAKKRISELEAERESWGNEFSSVITMKERITELELANNRLRKTWREDTEDLAKVRAAYLRELEKQAERISHLERKEVMWDQENRMLHRVCAENARLREALDGLKKVCDSDNSFASRVGMMSALIDRALESRQETKDGRLIDESANGAPSSVSTSVGTVKGSPISGPREGSNPSRPPTTVQDTGGQRCVCGHRGLWHEQSRRYIICESPGCECLQFTPIVAAQASNPEEHARNCIYDGTSWACAPACQVAQRPVQDCSCPDRHRTLGDCLVDHCGAATESDAECVHGNVISERVCPECTAQDTRPASCPNCGKYAQYQDDKCVDGICAPGIAEPDGDK